MGHPRRRGTATRVTVLLLSLLLIAATTVPVARAGILDKIKKKIKKDKNVLKGAVPEEPSAEVEESVPEPEPEPETGEEEEQPVCAGGDGTCSQEQHAPSPEEPVTTSDPIAPDDESFNGDALRTVEQKGMPDDKDQEDKEYFKCEDQEDNCLPWSQTSIYSNDLKRFGLGCEINSAYMHHYCALQCGQCETLFLGYRMATEMLEGGLAVIPFCQDHNFECRQFAEGGECEKNPEYMTMFCEASCGICSENSNKFGVGQKLYKDDPTSAKLISHRLANTMDYMNMVKRNRLYKPVRDACLNTVPDCTLWAVRGDCESNVEYMKQKCAPACMACDFLGDVSEPCRGLPEREPPLWAPGDLNQFFEEVVDNAEGKGDYYKQFKPKALSRPAKRSDGTTVPSVQKDGPWVVLLEDFLTSKEADRLVQIGHDQGYEGSLRAITPGQGEVTDGRTSENTWCTQPSCMEDPLVAKVLKRIAKTTKSTPNHREHLQMLRYDLETFYDQHHDFIPYQLDLPCGPRIMTLFLYLNDVEEGGNTGFPSLGISVKPKKGTALLWPSVKDKDPLERDPRMEHEAEKVLKGVKYGANAWIHNEDFQTPFALNCM